MPPLDWGKFSQLHGSRHKNFENLCRAMVQRHFGSAGHFRALKNQPGVEFHIQLTSNHSTLGSPPRWWGWQCKDHTRKPTGDLSAASRADIEDSINKTKKYLPDLTDWVLWTPYTLTRKDQKWLEGLSGDFDIHMWAEEEVDSYLDGPGLFLRQTYFGELVLSPEGLERQREESIQPIKSRWLEPVHQEVSAEREIQRILGDFDSWDLLAEVGERLANTIDAMPPPSAPLEDAFREQLARFSDFGSELARSLIDIHTMLRAYDLDAIQGFLQARCEQIDTDVRAVPRRLRINNSPAALSATNAIDDMWLAIELLGEIEEQLSLGLVAVLADAGGGKTQLAAQLTKQSAVRPAGVLLHGRVLHKGQSLDDVAASYRIGGMPVPSMEALIAALDAAGRRAECRLPLVIDGLNEAENPKDWKAGLASLNAMILEYPYVLVICTLRTGERQRRHRTWQAKDEPRNRETFAEWALPDSVLRIESEGFGRDVEEAISKYFAYFKIQPGDSEVPTALFSHPLTLRIFCQTNNPERVSNVTVDNFPASLFPLLENYLEHVCERIVQLENLSYSYVKDEVEAAIYHLGMAIWSSRKREICEDEFRLAVSDKGRDWDSSIVNLLAQEGVLFRDPAEQPHRYVLRPAYDALGGFLAAKALLEKGRNGQSFEWLKWQDSLCNRVITLLQRLFGRVPAKNPMDYFVGENSHELSTDIFRALIALTPPKFPGRQFWRELPGSLQASALRFTTEIEAKYIDKQTVDALTKLIQKDPIREARIFTRLQTVRGVSDHPLNSAFLDCLLRGLNVAGRDLSWTEWIRSTRDSRLADVLRLESKWKADTERSKMDLLLVKNLIWLLSSTDRELRDVTTRAIYWFGRGRPEPLFSEAISSLSIDDPYIPERVFAASYGVAMACYCSQEQCGKPLDVLQSFSKQIFASIFGDEAPYRTTHFLLRDYASRIIELAEVCSPGFFTVEELERSRPPYAVSESNNWGEVDIERDTKLGMESPLYMDFENYTIGTLVPNRGNYDYENEEYRHVRAKILWRIFELGWSSEEFSKVDRAIAENQSLSRTMPEPGKVDRYGKKYSWIAYFELAGMLCDQGTLERFHDYGRCSDVDIDPSFPEKASSAFLVADDFLGSSDLPTKDWIVNGKEPELAPYLRQERIEGQDGPWVMLDGYVSQQDKKRGRKTFIFVRTFLVQVDELGEFEKYLKKQSLAGRWLPEKPSFYYTFGGEIPWCSTYPSVGNTEFSFVEAEEEVEVERKFTEFFLDGEPVRLSSLDLLMLRKLLMEEDTDEGGSAASLSDEELSRIEVRDVVKKVKELKTQYTSFDALVPVNDFSWESHHTLASDAGHPVVLARELSAYLSLRGRPQTFELYDKNNTLATFQTDHRADGHYNSQSLMYLREDLLTNFLADKEMCLVGAIWGEREYSADQVEQHLHGAARPDPAHKIFSRIVRFNASERVWVDA